METLTLVPRGDVKKSYSFGTNKVEYENGNVQYQRKWITPRITYSFSAQGSKDDRTYLEDFIKARSGNFEPFYWEYGGEKLLVRFSDSTIEFTEVRGYEGTGVVGYKADIGLVTVKDSEV